MSRGLYSDLYLKSLLVKEPKLAKEFLEAIAKSEYVKEVEVISCTDVPDWVLEKAGIEATRNPNFPSKKFQEYLDDNKTIEAHFWRIFDYPHLSKDQIIKLSKSKNVNVRGMALLSEQSDSKDLLKFLKEVISSNDRSCYVVIFICQQIQLTDEIFNYLFTVHEYDGISRTIGQALWDNPTLSKEQQAALLLAEITPKDESNSDYWGDYDIHFISSIPYIQSFKIDLSHFKGQKFETIETIDTRVTEFFNKSGHHISAVSPVDYNVEIKVSVEGLREIVSLQLLHRLFWTDLCKRDDFAIYRRNAYRTDDLFISHPILGREFESTDAENATHLGGVFIFDNQNWLIGEEELPAEQAAHELRAYEESLVTIVEEGDYEHLGQELIALTFTIPDLAEKYGFELTDSAEDWMIEAAIEFAEPDSFDVAAHLDPSFGEVLSWHKLPDSKKQIIFDFLLLGFREKHSKLRSDSIHFLGCMALHESTPSAILKKLRELDFDLINEVLQSR